MKTELKNKELKKMHNHVADQNVKFSEFDNSVDKNRQISRRLE